VTRQQDLPGGRFATGQAVDSASWRSRALAEQQHGERGETESQHGEVCIGELATKGDCGLEESMHTALDPEQLG